jgi:hypothetical protein
LSQGPSNRGSADGGKARLTSFRDLAPTWVRIIAATMVVSAILAVSGAFGTGAVSILRRLIFWQSMTAAGVTLGIIASRFIVPEAWFERRPWVAGGAIVLIVSVPMTCLVALGDCVMNRWTFRVGLILEMFPSTLATSAALTALAFLIRPREPDQTHAAEKGAPSAKFLGRLPARLAGADLWAVEAEDHYLRLHTSLGQDLILMRLGDAIAELAGIEGARTHRSWWVAKAAVAGVERADGRATLTLVDGAEVPVSRAYAKALRESGWI